MVKSFKRDSAFTETYYIAWNKCHTVFAVSTTSVSWNLELLQYFRPDTPEEAGVWQPDKLQAWETASAAWLKAKFDVNLVQATFHRDEATPHIHAVIVPVNEKGHLCAKDFVGNRSKLVDLQDSYAAAMKPLGLSRGIRGSKAQHEAIKDFYKSVNQDLDEAYTPAQIRALAADRQRQVQRRNEMEKTAFSLSEENVQLKEELSLLRQQNQQLQQRLNQSDGLRLVSLVDVARQLGLQPSEFDPSQWRDENRYIRIDDPQFSIAGESMKGQGAIDLVMQVKRVSFADALVWLERQFGAGTARVLAMAQADMAASVVEETRFKLPAKSEDKWEDIRQHILQEISLPSKVLDTLYQQGLLYADEAGHAVFVERDGAHEVAGAMRWYGSDTYERVEHSRDEAAFYVVMPDNEQVGEAQRAVLTDTPTEALAKRVLETGRQLLPTKYIAISGPVAAVEHTKGIARVEVALKDGRVAQTLYRVIPDAIDAQPEISHQAALKVEMQQLRGGFRQSPETKPKAQERRKDGGMGL